MGKWTLVAALLLVPRCSHGSNCVPAQSVDAELAASDAVFIGRLIWTGEDPVPGDADTVQREYMFRVSRAWKGITERDTVSIFTLGAEDDIPFEMNRTYLVYARLSGTKSDTDGASFLAMINRLTTDRCSRTVPLADAKGDIHALGEPSYLNPSVAEELPLAGPRGEEER